MNILHFNRGLDESDKKEGLWKRLKINEGKHKSIDAVIDAINDQGEKQLDAIKEQGKKQIGAIEKAKGK